MAIAVVVHHNLNSLGGEAAVAIETIQSLNDLGYDVHLVTIQKPNIEAISKTSGKTIPVTKVYSLFPFKINYLGIYQKILTQLTSLKTRCRDSNYDKWSYFAYQHSMGLYLLYCIYIFLQALLLLKNMKILNIINHCFGVLTISHIRLYLTY